MKKSKNLPRNDGKRAEMTLDSSTRKKKWLLWWYNELSLRNEKKWENRSQVSIIKFKPMGFYSFAFISLGSGEVRERENGAHIFIWFYLLFAIQRLAFVCITLCVFSSIVAVVVIVVVVGRCVQQRRWQQQQCSY